MRQTLYRFRRGITWIGVGATLTLVGRLYFIIVEDFRITTITGLLTALAFLTSLVRSARAWGTYTVSKDTRPYEEVLVPLLSGRDEFCLLLRPFGADGRVLVTIDESRLSRLFRQIRPMLTLEQVLARSARQALGQSVYAIVDQDLKLAPPGPEYAACPPGNWRRPVTEMIRRAHTIVLFLPPGQSVRESLEWELEEILRLGRRDRVLILLPPRKGTRRAEYQECRSQAAAVLAKLNGDWKGRVADIPEGHLDLDRVPRGTLLIPAEPLEGAALWTEQQFFLSHKLTRVFVAAGSTAYGRLLNETLKLLEDKVRTESFEGRYPGAAASGDADAEDIRQRVRTDLGAAEHPSPSKDAATRPGVQLFRMVPWVPVVAGALVLGTAVAVNWQNDPFSYEEFKDEYRRRADAVPAPVATVDWGAPAEALGTHVCEVSLLHSSLSCYGRNGHGQLGTGDRADRHELIEVLSGRSWDTVLTGRSHTCAGDRSHTLWCWGANDHGQLGTGSVSHDRLEPYRVQGEWLSFGVEPDATCGWRMDDTQWCWGKDFAHPDGRRRTSLVPVRVPFAFQCEGPRTGRGPVVHANDRVTRTVCDLDQRRDPAKLAAIREHAQKLDDLERRIGEKVEEIEQLERELDLRP